ncbi:hypothetical protein FACS1894122_06780 [Alphaproteobacteria bacterium]|nr:hypothetical protein FACS1894122_06780 [Alphaproteobacteria bacterium]
MKNLILSFVMFGSFACLGSNVLAEEYANEVVDENEGGNADFNHMYFGFGIGFTLDKDSAKRIDTGANKSKNVNNFLGALYFGSGRVMNSAPVYLAGELGLDFSKTNRNSLNLNGTDVKFNHNGLSPSAGFRVGCVNGSSLFFLKLALSYVRVNMKCTEHDSDFSMSIAKLAPTIGIGAEKMLGKKYSTRIDLEYICKTKKTGPLYEPERKGAIRAKISLIYNASF